MGLDLTAVFQGISHGFAAWAFADLLGDVIPEQGVLSLPFSLWFAQARLLLDLLVIAWIVAVIDFGFLRGGLQQLGGLRPRKLGGLLGIPLSPFLHGNWDHLMGNSKYYLLFGGMIVLRDVTDFAMVTITAAVLSGLGEWVLGRPGRYVGASGVIFGYFGFLASLIYFSKDAIAGLFLILITFSFLFGDIFVFPALSGQRKWDFGKTLWGIFPSDQKNIAWEGHLFGFLSGIYAAQHGSEIKLLLKQIGTFFGSLPIS